MKMYMTQFLYRSRTDAVEREHAEAIAHPGEHSYCLSWFQGF